MIRSLAWMSPLVLLVPLSAQGLPDGEGRATYEMVCGACHGADIVIGSQGTRARWEEVVEAMRNRGAYGSDDDFKVVINYLARYFGTSVNVNTASAKELETELGLTAAEAEAIVKQRSAAAFKTFDELTKVPGVSAAKLQPVKGRITF
jgi:competence protein ComEA